MKFKGSLRYLVAKLHGCYPSAIVFLIALLCYHHEQQNEVSADVRKRSETSISESFHRFICVLAGNGSAIWPNRGQLGYVSKTGISLPFT